MNYITQTIDGREKLIAVVGDESAANQMIEGLSYRFSNDKISFNKKALFHLLKEKVEIPPSMHWLVESDRKHQEREVESRTENLCDLNFAPKNNGDELSICEVMERAAHRRDGMGNNSD